MKINIIFKLVGYPCDVMAHNNTHVNYPPKKSQDFLLIVSALRIIFFINARVPQAANQKPPSIASPTSKVSYSTRGGEDAGIPVRCRRKTRRRPGYLEATKVVYF